MNVHPNIFLNMIIISLEQVVRSCADSNTCIEIHQFVIGLAEYLEIQHLKFYFLSSVDGVWKSSTINFLAGLDPILD